MKQGTNSLVNGFINLDKGSGLSSQNAVSAIKRLLKVKAGHCGTLDPLATGVLPIALGKATRLSEYVMGRRKSYEGEICFGIVTDSYDAWGEHLSEQDASFVDAAAISALLYNFRGSIMQKPPVISALKRGGEPLYKKVRRGEDVQLEERQVYIYDLSLLEFIPNGAHPRCKISVTCGQGTYIRSIAHDLGRMLGCGAHLSALRRTCVGDFLAEDSYTVDQIQSMLEQDDFSFIISMDQATAHLPSIVIPQRCATFCSHGNAVRLTSAEAGLIPVDSILRVYDPYEKLLGVGSLSRLSDQKEDRLLQMNKVLIDIEEKQQTVEQKPLVACAIGNFDGMHRGHRALMEKLYELKTKYNGRGAVVTFSPHPLQLIKGKSPELISSEHLKNELLLERYGVDEIVTLTFDEKLMNSTPEEFVQNVIVESLGVSEVVVGYDFTYAKAAAGNAETLKEQCAKYGINVSIVYKVDGPYGKIGSTIIRRQLAEGNLDAVNDMLGYWFAMEGEVVYGNQIGRTIGFPTANFYPEEGQAIPQNGVYAVRIEHRGRTYNGVANFGIKPTVGGEVKPLVEAHIFDEKIDLYNDPIRVWFGKFLRPERKFSGLEELQAQIEADGQAARKFLAKISANQHLPKMIK